MPTQGDNTNPLKKINSRSLARDLSDELIQIVHNDINFGDGPVAQRLEKLRDAIWSVDKTQQTAPEQQKADFQDALKGLTSDEQTKLFEAYTHLGHIYDIAALSARENYFKQECEGGHPPDGLAKFIGGCNSVKEAVETLNKPVFEMVMTMHPTNINSLKFMQKQRDVAKAIEGGDMNEVKKALHAFQGVSVLHTVKAAGVGGIEKDVDANFTVRDETGIIINFLNNIYEDMDRVYKRCDEALKARGGNYNPLDLKLQTRFGSWGSAGDKDGNNNVTAETTLEAVALHVQAIVEKYSETMKSIPEDKLHELGLDGWQKKLKNASVALEKNLKDIGDLRADSDKVRKKGETVADMDFNRRFNELSAQLVEIRKPLDAKEFEKDLESAYKNSHDDNQDKLLSMVRKVRMFGFSFGKIEYRETAEEYTRVAELLIPTYADMAPEMRIKFLGHLLHDGTLGDILKRRDDVIKQGSHKAYSDDDTNPIAYHTLKRMELARDFPDIIQDNVLAEAGKPTKEDIKGLAAAHVSPEEVKSLPNLPEEEINHNIQMRGASNMLEAVLMQRLADKDGKHPVLGVVPLFEEPETMKNIRGIMKNTYENPFYMTHMQELAAAHHAGKITQQVQIAHSDNARRAGLQAARAYIHEAHREIRDLNKDFELRDEHGVMQKWPIQTEFFEGGSISDAYRNGVRSISATTRELGLENFAKFTFQGGDLLNYLNVPASADRLFSRALANQAQLIKDDAERGPDVKSALELVSFSPFNKVAIAALKKTWDDYAKEDFTTDKMGKLLAVIGYSDELKAGGRGSRAGERTAGAGMAFAKVSSTGVGAIVPIPIDKVRTIGFSEAWQHAGIVPSWIGSQKLEEHLQEEISKTLSQLKERNSDSLSTREKSFLEEFKDVPEHGFKAHHAHVLYDQAPAFRDAQDRSAFALALTDEQAMKALEKKIELQCKDSTEDKNLIDYFEHLKRTRVKAAKLAYAARKGEDLSPEADIQSKMAHDALPRLEDTIGDKTRYRSFLIAAKEVINEITPESLGLGEQEARHWKEHVRGIMHNAGDTVSHGRWPLADDPSYGKAYWRTAAEQAQELERASPAA